MTTWDERAAAEAWRKGIDEYWAGDPRVFRAGAAWQRDQLLADDVIERAARELNAAGWTCMDGTHEPGHYDDCPYCRGVGFGIARTAFIAALGDPA